MAADLKRIAVIGSGVSGLTSAKYLKSAGSEVVVYERSSTLGGIWTYDERQPLEPPYPSTRPSVFGSTKADEENETHKDDIEYQKLLHAPPSPAYSSLTTNVAVALSELEGHPWKLGTPEFVNVRVVGEYLQSYAQAFDIGSLINYDTRVEQLKKVGGKWQITSTTLITDGPEPGKKVAKVEEFDGVVVASGHYNDGLVPDFPGLKEWKAAWPERVQHSKRYRRPDDFKDQTVLIIGASVSSLDIAREITGVAKKIYQVSRAGKYDLPATWLPPNAERVSQVKSFETPADKSKAPGQVTLVDGTVLNGIGRVVVATGYHNSFPFLLEYHSDTLSREEADEKVIVTDGSQVHNLHKDIFYIPDPTLAFIGLPYQVPTFKFFEFQSIAAAAVLSGKAKLPPTEKMRAEYRERVEKRGFGREFHALGKDLTIPYIDELVAWINRDAESTGERRSRVYRKNGGERVCWV